MKILFLTTHLNTGGITSYLLSLTGALNQKGHKVFIASASGNCKQSFEKQGAIVFDLGFRTKSELNPKIYLSLSRLKNLVREEQIDVLHAHTRVTQVMGFFLSKMTGKPMITTCHGFFKPHFFRRIFSCWGQGVIAISKPVYTHLINDFKVPAEQVFLVENGIDIESFKEITDDARRSKRQELGIKAKYVLGVIARLSSVKGLDVLIRSMKEIVEQIPDVQLIIVGEGPEDKALNELVANLNLASYVRFEKIVNQTADILPIFDIFIMPSRQEGLGLSVMEAQACALPVIASRVGGLIDLIDDGVTGYLVSPENHHELTQKIVKVLNHLPESSKVGKMARQKIIEKFSLNKMVTSTLRIYEKYISR